MLTRTQINRAGDRLRRASTPDEADRRIYDEFRAGFAEPLNDVLLSLTELAGDRPVASRLKRFETTVEKLRRHKSRLSRIEDIAGCRVVLPTTHEKHELLALVTRRWEVVRTRDYQAEPRGGYRALHVVVRSRDHPVEVQLRTELEEQWANTTEALADMVDPELKYGGGSALLREVLNRASAIFAEFDEALSLDHRFRRALGAIRDDSASMRVLRASADSLDDRAVGVHGYLMGRVIEGASVVARLFRELEDESVAGNENAVILMRAALVEALDVVPGLAAAARALTESLEGVVSVEDTSDRAAPQYNRLVECVQNLENMRGG